MERHVLECKTPPISSHLSLNLRSEVYKPKENMAKVVNMSSPSSYLGCSAYSACDKEDVKENEQVLKLSSRKRSFFDVSSCSNDEECQSTPKQMYKRARYASTSSRYSLPEAAKSEFIDHVRRKSIPYDKHQDHSFHHSTTKKCSTDQTPYSPYIKAKQQRYSLPEAAKSKIIDHVRRKSVPYDKHQHHSFHHSMIRKCSTDQTPYSPYTKAKQQRTILPRYNAWALLTFKSGSFIDTHCHLDFLFQRQNYTGTYKSYQELNRSTFPECYDGCIAVFCNPFSFTEKQVWQKFLKEENVWGAFGCHPHNSKDYSDEIEAALKIALKDPKVCAFGEIGLDYSTRNNCDRTVQHNVFKRQLKIAKKHELPLVIHCREAHKDCLKILQKVIPDNYFIHLHCFTDTWDWAKVWLDAYPNLFIGITNVVTFPSAETVHDVAKNIPLDRLLLETDAPYFVPKQIGRGTRWSHPGMAIHVAGQIGALRDMPIKTILNYARQNTKKMYGI